MSMLVVQFVKLTFKIYPSFAAQNGRWNVGAQGPMRFSNPRRSLTIWKCGGKKTLFKMADLNHIVLIFVVVAFLCFCVLLSVFFCFCYDLFVSFLILTPYSEWVSLAKSRPWCPVRKVDYDVPCEKLSMMSRAKIRPLVFGRLGTFQLSARKCL